MPNARFVAIPRRSGVARANPRLCVVVWVSQAVVNSPHAASCPAIDREPSSVAAGPSQAPPYTRAPLLGVARQTLRMGFNKPQTTQNRGNHKIRVFNDKTWLLYMNKYNRGSCLPLGFLPRIQHTTPIVAATRGLEAGRGSRGRQPCLGD